MQIDRIVTGTRAGGIVRRVFHGSVSKSVLEHAPCAVVIVPPIASLPGDDRRICLSYVDAQQRRPHRRGLYLRQTFAADDVDTGASHRFKCLGAVSTAQLDRSARFLDHVCIKAKPGRVEGRRLDAHIRG